MGKTQAKLREIAAGEVNWGGNSDEVRKVLADYLRLTDQLAAVTADHCRAAGMGDDSARCFVDGRLTVDCFSDDYRTLVQSNPTVGLLYAAQRQEETR